tara:strand:- start:60 stop:179 length:120 start_codon:yes stop_codon:yes gene_type:complete
VVAEVVVDNQVVDVVAPVVVELEQVIQVKTQVVEQQMDQ